jgi:hypothetical protein
MLPSADIKPGVVGNGDGPCLLVFIKKFFDISYYNLIKVQMVMSEMDDVKSFCWLTKYLSIPGLAQVPLELSLYPPVNSERAGYIWETNI